MKRYGMCLGMGFRESEAEQAELLAKVGYDACFTGWNEGCPVADWARAIHANGLEYQSIHAPFLKADTLWEAGEAGEAYTDVLIRCLHDCAELGVGIMVTHVIIGMDKHSPNKLGLCRLERLMKAAESCGVAVAYENTEGAEYLKAVMDAFRGSPACKFCIDTGHEQCYNYGQDMLALYGDRLVGTHLNDNLGMADRQVMTWLDDSHLLPGDGSVDWAGVRSRLDKCGYEGILTMELTRDNRPGRQTHGRYASWSCEEFMRQALVQAKRIFE